MIIHSIFYFKIDSNIYLELEFKTVTAQHCDNNNMLCLESPCNTMIINDVKRINKVCGFNPDGEEFQIICSSDNTADGEKIYILNCQDFVK